MTDLGEVLPEEQEAQPRELIVTLFGLYARAEGNWLAVSALVRLMAEIGVEGPAVRSSVSRLKRRNILTSVRRNGVAGYELSPAAMAVLAEGDTRIFHRRRAASDDGWLMLVFSVPESERDKRHALRSSLTRLGFGTVSPGVWIAPGHMTDEVRGVLERRGLAEYVELFEGVHVGVRPTREAVETWWDFGELTHLYAAFLDRYRAALDAVDALAADRQKAFAAYVPMLTEWRRLPYLDPGLPVELLPAEWNGLAAERLFTELNRALAKPAGRHARGVIHGEG
ncbi:PaaX family transcriptional regulator [Nocardia terpenica]|uniref:PaaX family transcriptional regulator n=1 Tax=Nocardia terpenica TaxID=455432 RepID=A0A291RR92_9NOCA|nr:PaaX family transcriptional regulator C-terminal domain-containing protein [Nocardia terpenica]ATL69754.1 PaaX family transcriptional regulator [Nocardia terpenica]